MINNMFNSELCGIKITEDINMTVPGNPYEQKKTIKERFFSWPWRPFQATKTIIPMVPSKEVLCWENNYIMHPSTKKEFLNSLVATEDKRWNS